MGLLHFSRLDLPRLDLVPLDLVRREIPRLDLSRLGLVCTRFTSTENYANASLKHNVYLITIPQVSVVNQVAIIPVRA